MSSFKPARRERLTLRMALEGPSGSGKTITALRIAQGLGGKIAVIDTENRSASRYIGEDFGDGPISFDVVELDSFEPRRLVALLNEAANAGYDVIVVDSLSHFWMGEGGMLDIVDAAAKKSGGGNSFAGWKSAKPDERALWDALIRCRAHLICTLRTKTEYVIEDVRGKKAPRKVGLKAEQREGLEYEFDVVGDISIDHDLTCSKTRCSALDGKAFTKPGADVARILSGWLNSGDAPAQRDADQRRQTEQRPSVEGQAEQKAPPPFNFGNVAAAMRKLDDGWTDAAILAQLGAASPEAVTRDPAVALYEAAKAGNVRPPQPPRPPRPPQQNSNTQQAGASGEDGQV